MKHGQQWYICHLTITGMIGIECAKPTMLWGYHMMEYDYQHKFESSPFARPSPQITQETSAARLWCPRFSRH